MDTGSNCWYIGDTKEGKPHGIGTHFQSDHRNYEGIWENGECIEMTKIILTGGIRGGYKEGEVHNFRGMDYVIEKIDFEDNNGIFSHYNTKETIYLKKVS